MCNSTAAKFVFNNLLDVCSALCQICKHQRNILFLLCNIYWESGPTLTLLPVNSTSRVLETQTLKSQCQCQPLPRERATDAWSLVTVSTNMSKYGFFCFQKTNKLNYTQWMQHHYNLLIRKVSRIQSFISFQSDWKHAGHWMFTKIAPYINTTLHNKSTGTVTHSAFICL